MKLSVVPKPTSVEPRVTESFTNLSLAIAPCNIALVTPEAEMSKVITCPEAAESKPEPPATVSD